MSLSLVGYTVYATHKDYVGKRHFCLSKSFVASYFLSELVLS